MNLKIHNQALRRLIYLYILYYSYIPLFYKHNILFFFWHSFTVHNNHISDKVKQNILQCIK